MQATAAGLFPGVPVEIRVDLDETDVTLDELDDTVGPAEVLIDAARRTTGLPWNCLRPADYPWEGSSTSSAPPVDSRTSA